jgi:hypothetical protein
MGKFSLGDEFSKKDIVTEDTTSTKKTSKYSSFLESQISEPVKQEASVNSKRINMAFTPGNIELIEKLVEKYNINRTFLINSIVRIITISDVNEYLKNERILRSKAGVIKGKPKQKRITLRIDDDNYQKVSSEADVRNQTITQYVNLLLEIFENDMIAE